MRSLPQSYSLLINDDRLCTLLLPAEQAGLVSWHARSLTGIELNQIVQRLMVQLSASFFASESVRYVIVAAEDPLTVLLSCLAVWRSQKVAVLPNNLRPSTLNELRNAQFGQADPGPFFHPLLDDSSMAQALQTLDRQMPDNDIAGVETLSEDEVLLLCFTSGSTGQAQCHEKLARQVLGEAALLARELMSELKGPVAASVPAYHLYGLLFSALAPFCGNLPLLGALGYLDQKHVTAPPLNLLVKAGKAAGLVSVPAHLSALLETDAALLSQAKTIFSSSAPLNAAVGHGILRLKPTPKLVEIWGSTETGGVAARINDPGGIWRPFAGLICETENEHLKLRSPFTPCGMDTPLLTSDKIKIENNGFSHLGRDDGVIKVGGKRVALQDLERCALRHPQVKDVACLALNATGIRNQMIAMAVAVDDPSLSERTLLAHLSVHFDAVVLPRKVRIVPSLPRAKTGKIKRDDLLALFTQRRTGKPQMTSSEQIKAHLEQAGFCHVIIDELKSNAETQLFSFEVRTHHSQLWFQGHFPNAPILPGVVQMKTLVLGVARLLWCETKELCSLTKVKFKRPIIPGDQLRISLSYTPTKELITFAVLWLENDGQERSPLQDMLPHVFALKAPAETSSGTFSFKTVQSDTTGAGQ